jgi:hypothetical protein
LNRDHSLSPIRHPSVPFTDNEFEFQTSLNPHCPTELMQPQKSKIYHKFPILSRSINDSDSEMSDDNQNQTNANATVVDDQQHEGNNVPVIASEANDETVAGASAIVTDPNLTRRQHELRDELKTVTDRFLELKLLMESDESGNHDIYDTCNKLIDVCTQYRSQNLHMIELCKDHDCICRALKSRNVCRPGDLFHDSSDSQYLRFPNPTNVDQSRNDYLLSFSDSLPATNTNILSRLAAPNVNIDTSVPPPIVQPSCNKVSFAPNPVVVDLMPDHQDFWNSGRLQVNNVLPYTK